jgi:Cytidylate kinase-like family
MTSNRPPPISSSWRAPEGARYLSRRAPGGRWSRGRSLAAGRFYRRRRRVFLAPMRIIALSAAYGAAGSRIGPALAERLGVPFIDRGIALAVAERLDISVDDALAHEEPNSKGLLERLLSGFLGADPCAPGPLPADAVTPEDFHRASQHALLAQAATGRGVILGRGAVAALRHDPRVLRVRVTGPVQRRIEHAIRFRDLDRDTAERTVHALDRAHADYLRASSTTSTSSTPASTTSCSTRPRWTPRSASTSSPRRRSRWTCPNADRAVLNAPHLRVRRATGEATKGVRNMRHRGRLRRVGGWPTTPAPRRGEREPTPGPVMGSGPGLGLRRGRLPASVLDAALSRRPRPAQD